MRCKIKYIIPVEPGTINDAYGSPLILQPEWKFIFSDVLKYDEWHFYLGHLVNPFRIVYTNP